MNIMKFLGFTIVVTPVIVYTWSLSWQTCGSVKFPSKSSEGVVFLTCFGVAEEYKIT